MLIAQHGDWEACSRGVSHQLKTTPDGTADLSQPKCLRCSVEVLHLRLTRISSSQPSPVPVHARALSSATTNTFIP